MTITPYIYRRSLAEKATDHAEEGSCVARWFRAAYVWEQAMKCSSLSKFSIEICQSFFKSRFVKWLSRHPHIQQNYKVRSKS